LQEVKADLDKISPKILELEDQFEGGIRGTPDQVVQAKRVLQKLLDEWSTLSITVGQMLLRSPVSKSPSPSPFFSSSSPQTSDIMDLETWLDEMEVKMKELKESSQESNVDNAKEQLKNLESQVSKRHR
jgi:hypothetical protein